LSGFTIFYKIYRIYDITGKFIIGKVVYKTSQIFVTFLPVNTININSGNRSKIDEIDRANDWNVASCFFAVCSVAVLFVLASFFCIGAFFSLCLSQMLSAFYLAGAFPFNDFRCLPVFFAPFFFISMSFAVSLSFCLPFSFVEQVVDHRHRHLMEMMALPLMRSSPPHLSFALLQPTMNVPIAYSYLSIVHCLQ
jgi:hypothetical protein